MIPDASARSLPDLLSLTGRTAVITGGASGIGLATARRFAEAGATVVVADLNEAAGLQAVAQLPAPAGARHDFVSLDMSDPGAPAAAVAAVVARHGGLHIWANIAGIYPIQDTLGLAPEQWQRVIAVNLGGTFFGSREAARQMQIQGTGGVILNTHSSTAYNTPPGGGLAAYVASKGGVEALTKALAHEFGPSGIRVLAVSPTMTATPGMEQQRTDSADVPGGKVAADAPTQYAAHLPLRRLATPDDIARVFLFAASDLSLVMTGSLLIADAGDLVV